MTAVPTALLDAVDLGRAVGGVGGWGALGGFGTLCWEGAEVLGSAWESEPRLFCGSLAPSLLRLASVVGSGCLLSVVQEQPLRTVGWPFLAEGRVRTSGPVIPGLISDPSICGSPQLCWPWGWDRRPGHRGPCGIPGEEGGQEQVQAGAGRCAHRNLHLRITPSPRPPAPRSSVSPSSPLLPFPQTTPRFLLDPIFQ